MALQEIADAWADGTGKKSDTILEGLLSAFWLGEFGEDSLILPNGEHVTTHLPGRIARRMFLQPYFMKRLVRTRRDQTWGRAEMLTALTIIDNAENWLTNKFNPSGTRFNAEQQYQALATLSWSDYEELDIDGIFRTTYIGRRPGDDIPFAYEGPVLPRKVFFDWCAKRDFQEPMFWDFGVKTAISTKHDPRNDGISTGGKKAKRGGKRGRPRPRYYPLLEKFLALRFERSGPEYFSNRGFRLIRSDFHDYVRQKDISVLRTIPSQTRSTAFEGHAKRLLEKVLAGNIE